MMTPQLVMVKAVKTDVLQSAITTMTPTSVPGYCLPRVMLGILTPTIPLYV
jgi:hypothetical protein